MYRIWDRVKILPYEDCDTSYWPWYNDSMIHDFERNPEVEIVSIEPYHYHLDEQYAQYQVKIMNSTKTWWVNDSWIAGTSNLAIFI